MTPRIRYENDAGYETRLPGLPDPSWSSIFPFGVRQPAAAFFTLNANPSSCSGRFLKRAISSNPILAAPQFNLFATAIFA